MKEIGWKKQKITIEHFSFVIKKFIDCFLSFIVIFTNMLRKKYAKIYIFSAHNSLSFINLFNFQN